MFDFWFNIIRGSWAVSAWYETGLQKCVSRDVHINDILLILQIIVVFGTKTCQNYDEIVYFIFFSPMSCPSAQMYIFLSTHQFSLITSLVATISTPSPITAGHWKMLFQQEFKMNDFNWTKLVYLTTDMKAIKYKVITEICHWRKKRIKKAPWDSCFLPVINLSVPKIG